MSIQDLGSLGELIAAIATVGTLFYLALQIRQNTQALRGSAHETSTTRRTTWLLGVAQSPELSDLMDRALRDAVLTDTERVRAGRLVGSVLAGVETSYWQWKRGNLELEQWEPSLRILRNLLRAQFVRDYWASGDPPHTAAFRALVDEELRKVRG